MATPHMFDVWSNVTTLEECVILAEFMDNPKRADLVHFNVEETECYFGDLLPANKNYTAMTLAENLTFIDVYVRGANSYTKLNFKYDQVNASMPGSEWAPRMYRTIQTGTFDRCKCACAFDGEPCTIYVWADPDCHLGAYNIESTVVTDTTARDVYYSLGMELARLNWIN